MAAPTVNAVTEAVAASGADLVLNVPSHSSGDLLVWIAMSGGGATRYWVYPGGWTEIGSLQTVTVGTIDRNFQAYYRIAGGSEPSTYTATPNLTFQVGGGIMYSVSGAEDPATTAPVKVVSADGASGTANTPSITPTDADSLVIRFAANAQTGAGSVTPPSGYTEQIDSRGSTIMWAGNAVKAASATGTESFTYTPTFWGSPAWGHLAVALAPTGGGGSSIAAIANHYRRLRTR